MLLLRLPDRGAKLCTMVRTHVSYSYIFAC